MEQFQNKSRSNSHRQSGGVFDILRSAFRGVTAMGRPSSEADRSLDALHLPAHGYEDRSLAPSFRTLYSSTGKPTVVTIQSEPCQERHGGSQIHISARRNSGGARYELDYYFITAANGDRILRGSISEVGQLPHVPGASSQERPHGVLRFYLAVHRNSKAEAVCLTRSAWSLVESFVEDGVEGVDQQLERSQRLIALTEAHVSRSSRYSKGLSSQARVRINYSTFRPEDDPSDYFTRNPLHREVYEAIQTAMSQLASLSQDEFKRLTGPEQAELEDVSSLHHDEIDEPPPFRFVERWFAGVAQADFYTPEADKYSSLTLRLSVPYTRLDHEARFNLLRLEILRPRGAFGLRERLRVNDCNDTLAVTQFSYNDELFRNLFRTMHRVNCSQLLHDDKIQSVLDMLAQYELYPRVANPQACIGSLRRWAFVRNDPTQFEHTEPES